MKNKVISILVIFIFVFPISAFAGEYVLVEGKGVEVCEAYGKNLNSFNPNWPMKYRKLNPAMKDFKRTQWLYLDDIRNKISHNPDYEISKYVWNHDVNPVSYSSIYESKWRGTKKQMDDAYKIFLYFRHKINRWKVPNNHLIAEIDIDNDGITETVYQDSMYSHPTLLLVLKKDYSDIDYEKTKLVTMHPRWKDLGLSYFKMVEKNTKKVASNTIKNDSYELTEDSLSNSIYDVFLFKGKTYFDLWGFPDEYVAPKWRSESDNYLKVYVIENKNTKQICKYKFVMNNKK